MYFDKRLEKLMIKKKSNFNQTLSDVLNVERLFLFSNHVGDACATAVGLFEDTVA